MVILHESGNQNDVYDPNAILNEVKYMRIHFNDAYATYFVGGGGQIYQIGEPGYVAWAALSANPYAPVQIELARTADRATFLKDYATYIELARKSAKDFGIPLTLDTGGAGTPGIKTHQWVTNNYGGDHVDPYAYFASWGITKARLATDLANGVGTVTPTNPNIVTVKYVSGYGVNALDKYGRQIKGSNLRLKHGTAWKAFGVYILGGVVAYDIGGGWYLPQQYTDQAGIVTVNYAPGYGVLAVDANGKHINGSNVKFKTGTKWKSSAARLIKGKVFYQLSKTEFLEAAYTNGGGYK
ncbi:N-acetylmuramoyl-L-alanine amidase [Lacticaseibacillus brantae DSM 23927]|uniref:N-acetylmuramoyl-L-alanine amidase n=2 Tax=Lacticaseibacillus brantae TaxID=943673 RepID=A0A0R2BBH5_9LACO|nr:N-acetylmuramoyl-L-alanine amidase [Lacticaseibacillus brantae DSM 23927]